MIADPATHPDTLAQAGQGWCILHQRPLLACVRALEALSPEERIMAAMLKDETVAALKARVAELEAVLDTPIGHIALDIVNRLVKQQKYMNLHPDHQFWKRLEDVADSAMVKAVHLIEAREREADG